MSDDVGVGWIRSRDDRLQAQRRLLGEVGSLEDLAELGFGVRVRSHFAHRLSSGRSVRSAGGGPVASGRAKLLKAAGVWGRYKWVRDRIVNLYPGLRTSDAYALAEYHVWSAVFVWAGGLLESGDEGGFEGLGIDYDVRDWADSEAPEWYVGLRRSDGERAGQADGRDRLMLGDEEFEELYGLWQLARARLTGEAVVGARMETRVVEKVVEASPVAVVVAEVGSAAVAPVKRKRGRPRKHPLPLDEGLVVVERPLDGKEVPSDERKPGDDRAGRVGALGVAVGDVAAVAAGGGVVAGEKGEGGGGEGKKVKAAKPVKAVIPPLTPPEPVVLAARSEEPLRVPGFRVVTDAILAVGEALGAPRGMYTEEDMPSLTAAALFKAYRGNKMEFFSGIWAKLITSRRLDEIADTQAGDERENVLPDLFGALALPTGVASAADAGLRVDYGPTGEVESRARHRAEQAVRHGGIPPAAEEGGVMVDRERGDDLPDRPLTAAEIRVGQEIAELFGSSEGDESGDD